MNPADRDRLVATVHEKVVELLGPLGIEVSHAPARPPALAEFTFKVPDPGPKGEPGRFSELVIHLDAHQAGTCLADPAQIEALPRAWARILADWVPNLFDAAPLPAPDEVDWRPGEVLPEDFRVA